MKGMDLGCILTDSRENMPLEFGISGDEWDIIWILVVEEEE